MDWSYFDRFDHVCDKYLPESGEGDNMATQIVTAVCKLVYKWYNDGDVYDNTYFLSGWANDLSSYANWLYKNTFVSELLDGIKEIVLENQYEELLASLADSLLGDEEWLEEMSNKPKVGTIYDCDDPFHFIEKWGEDEEDDWEEDGEYWGSEYEEEI